MAQRGSCRRLTWDSPVEIGWAEIQALRLPSHRQPVAQQRQVRPSRAFQGIFAGRIESDFPRVLGRPLYPFPSPSALDREMPWNARHTPWEGVARDGCPACQGANDMPGTCCRAVRPAVCRHEILAPSTGNQGDTCPNCLSYPVRQVLLACTCCHCYWPGRRLKARRGSGHNTRQNKMHGVHRYRPPPSL